MQDSTSQIPVTLVRRRYLWRTRRRLLRQLAHAAQRLDLENLKEARDFSRWLLLEQTTSDRRSA